jgi:DegV family protein with EDD domain
MKKIAIITDTDSSLPVQVAEQYGIRQVPITIHFENENFTDGLDIDNVSLFERVDRLKKLPTTAAPSPAAFAGAFESALSDGAESIVCLCVSSKISSTYQSALSAADLFPGRDIAVVDTLSLSMGQGMMVLAAAEAAQAGASQAEVIAQALDTGRRVSVYAVLSTLKYLAYSGRVGKIAAGLADTLNIKPLLSVKDGKLDLLERVRTRKKAVERMIELAHGSLNGKEIERAAILHVNDLAGANDLRRMLSAALPCPKDILMVEFCAGLAVHTGSGVVGFAIVACE